MTDQTLQEQGLFAGIEMGVGAWQWGDRLYWGYQQGYNDQDIRNVFETAIAAGITFFDTAEVYAQGKSELMLGKLKKGISQPLIVATKFMPFPWRLTHGSLHRALQGSLRRLGIECVDLYQIHQPLPPIKVKSWMEAMVEVVQLGLVKAVGVSNYDLGLTRRSQDALAKEGVSLCSNQMEYSLLDRTIEKSGLLAHCQATGTVLIAYSPLAQGVLTGKYSPENPPRGFRANKYSRKLLQQVQPLIALLRKIGSDHGGKSIAQVALNWVICKGAIPIPGAKNIQQMEIDLGATGWRLTEQEIALLDEASDHLNRAR